MSSQHLISMICLLYSLYISIVMTKKYQHWSLGGMHYKVASIYYVLTIFLWFADAVLVAP